MQREWKLRSKMMLAMRSRQLLRNAYHCHQSNVDVWYLSLLFLGWGTAATTSTKVVIMLPYDITEVEPSDRTSHNLKASEAEVEEDGGSRCWCEVFGDPHLGGRS